MKQKPFTVRKESILEPYDIVVGYCEGFPVLNHVSIQDQKDAIYNGISLDDLYEFNSQPRRDWQADC